MRSPNTTTQGDKGTVPWPTVAAILFALVAILAIAWALVLNNRADSLQVELNDVRENANATMYTLEPTEFAPSEVQGRVFVSISGSGVVTASNLPQPGDNEAYQLWYLMEDESVVFGGTFSVDENGQGFGLIPVDAPEYTGIAISLESVGNEQPEGTYLLVASMRSGRG